MSLGNRRLFMSFVNIGTLEMTTIRVGNGSMSMPKNGAVIWLHAMGELGGEISQFIAPHVPYLIIQCPAADPRTVGCKSAPTTAWFDQEKLEVRGDADSTASPEGLHESIKLVHERIEYFEEALNIASERIIIGGFGQGATLAIASALSCYKRLGGVIAHSGWQCQPANELAEFRGSKNLQAPWMIIHGKADEAVEPQAATAAAATLRSLGAAQVHLRIIEGVEHAFSKESCNLLVDFIRTTLPAAIPKPKASDAPSAPTPALSKTVVKMNRRTPPPPASAVATTTTTTSTVSQEPPVAAAAGTQPGHGPTLAPPTSARPTGAPPTKANHAAGPREVRFNTGTFQLETVASSTATSAASSEGGPAGAAADPNSPSTDEATARALAAQDKAGLVAALEARGDDKPLGEAEMLEIAKLMLGKDLAGSDAFKSTFEQTLRSGPSQPPPGTAGGRRTTADAVRRPCNVGGSTGGDSSAGGAAELDSDDEVEEAAADEPNTASGSSQEELRAEFQRRAAASAAATEAEAAAGANDASSAPSQDGAASNAAPAASTARRAPSAPITAPHTLSESVDGGSLQLVVPLPEGVMSMAALALEVSPRRIELEVEGAPYLALELPASVDDERAAAKFAKKARELRVTLPLAAAS